MKIGIPQGDRNSMLGYEYGYNSEPTLQAPPYTMCTQTTNQNERTMTQKTEDPSKAKILTEVSFVIWFGIKNYQCQQYANPVDSEAPCAYGTIGSLSRHKTSRVQPQHDDEQLLHDLAMSSRSGQR
jgi:hypothetical protein